MSDRSQDYHRDPHSHHRRRHSYASGPPNVSFRKEDKYREEHPPPQYDPSKGRPIKVHDQNATTSAPVYSATRGYGYDTYRDERQWRESHGIVAPVGSAYAQKSKKYHDDHRKLSGIQRQRDAHRASSPDPGWSNGRRSGTPQEISRWNQEAGNLAGRASSAFQREIEGREKMRRDFPGYDSFQGSVGHAKQIRDLSLGKDKTDKLAERFAKKAGKNHH